MGSVIGNAAKTSVPQSSGNSYTNSTSPQSSPPRQSTYTKAAAATGSAIGASAGKTYPRTENRAQGTSFNTSSFSMTDAMNAYLASSNARAPQTPIAKEAEVRDPFLEGFNLYSSRIPPTEQTKTNQGFKAVGTSVANATDDFLEGFNFYSKPDRSFPSASASKSFKNLGTAVRKPTDPFLEGFNDPYGEKRNVFDVLEDPVFLVTKVEEWGASPFSGTEFEYRNLDEIWKETNSPVRFYQRGGKRTAEPFGSFGIAAKNSPELTVINGKDVPNYILSFNTKYIDENGKLRTSEVPQWVFNRDGIKAANARKIDNAAKRLESVLPRKQGAAIAEAAEKMKVRSNNWTDTVSTKVETWMNGVDEASGQARMNDKLAKHIDDLPKMLDNGAVKRAGKAISFLGNAFDVISLGYTMKEDIEEDGVIGYETVKEAVGIVGEKAGSAIGAKIGIWLGATIGGAISGGVLAAPLAALGGLIGGYLGGRIGGEFSERFVEKNSEAFA